MKINDWINYRGGYWKVSGVLVQNDLLVDGTHVPHWFYTLTDADGEMVCVPKAELGASDDGK